MKAGDCAGIFIPQRQHKEATREGGNSGRLRLPSFPPSRPPTQTRERGHINLSVDHFSTPMVDQFSLPIDTLCDDQGL